MVGALRQLDRRALDAEMFEEYDEKYQWPLALGIVILLAEMLVSDRRRRRNEDARSVYPVSEEAEPEEVAIDE
jgi:hypothetical protein